MNILAWIFQVILAGMFMMVGTMKLRVPKEKLSAKMGWVNDFSQTQVRIIGALEVLGAIGLILPLALNIMPILTAWAAVGLMLTMIVAAATHGRRKEFKMLPINGILFVLALVVAVIRF